MKSRSTFSAVFFDMFLEYTITQHFFYLKGGSSQWLRVDSIELVIVETI